MPIYDVQAADGKIYSVEAPEGTPQEQIFAFVQSQMGQINKPQPQPQEGIGAALTGGFKRFLSTGETALESIINPELAARRGQERAQQIGEQYAPGASLEKVKQAYEQRGLFPAVGEAISQIPAALAEQSPQIAATLGAAKAGALAGGAFGPVGSLVGGIGAAAVPSLIQLYGANLERQAEEKAPEISRTAALGAAVPGAALEVASTFIPLGRGLIGKLLGPNAEKALARGSNEAIERAARESVAATLAKGTITGSLAEIPTEVAQQMLERYQAGLDLTGEDALKEYGEAAYGAGLVGGPFGAGARALGRPGAREEFKRIQEEEARQLAVTDEELAQRFPETLPGGFKIQTEELGREMTPVGFNIMAEGRDTPLAVVDTAEEAQAKVESLSQIREQERAKLLEEEQKINTEVEKAQARLEQLEATEQADTEEYRSLKADLPNMMEQRAQKIEELYGKVQSLGQPLTAVPFGETERVNQQFTVLSPESKPLGSFKTMGEAEAAIKEVVGEEQYDTIKRNQEVAKDLYKTFVPQMRKFGLGDVGLKIVDQIEGGKAGGSYLNKLIQVALDEDTPIQTMRHESLHAMKDLGFFTPQQWKALEERANKEWIKTYLEGQEVEIDGQKMSRLDGYRKLGYSEQDILEEAIADAFGAYDKGQKPPPGMIAALFKRIKQFFANLNQALRGAGFQSADEIFGQIESGKLKPAAKAKPAEEEKLSLKTVDDVINDGVDRLVKAARKGRIREDRERFDVGNARADTNLTKVQEGIEKRLKELGVSTERDERGSTELEKIIGDKVMPAYRAKLKELESVRFGEEKLSLKPSTWKADKADLKQAEEYFDENGIMPYTSEGQIEVPLEGKGTKFSIKKPYDQKAMSKDQTLKNDPLTGLPMNANGTVTLYFPTDNAGARDLAKTKRLKGANAQANRVYLTNESSAAAVQAKPGMIDQPLGGANVLLQVDPSLLHVLEEYDDGRKDFFIPIAEGEYFAKKMAQTKLFTLNAPRTKGLHPDRTLAQVTKSVNDTADKWAKATKAERAEMARDAKTTLREQHNIEKLFGANSKLEKTNIGDYGLTYNGKKVMSTGLGFASAQKINDEQRATTCPQSGICEDLCLGETSGQNLLYGGEGEFRSGPRLSQFLKTEALVVNPEAFAVMLIKQIENFRNAAKKLGYQPAIRLNVTSDFNPKMFENVINMFPDVMFYDYTKLDTKPIAPNHHLTYSSTGASQVVNGETILNKFTNWDRMVDKILSNGKNVAMAFTSRNDMPKEIFDERTGKTFQVWNGDEYDARFLDPVREDGQGWIIGLTNKDNTTKPEDAAKKHNGFFLDYDKARDGDTLIIRDQNKLAGKPSGKVVPIAKLSLKAPTTPEFKQFFGKSKVVDNEGKPKFMYHGLAKDTTDFTRKTARGAPIFLTDDPKFAERFAFDSYEGIAKNASEYLNADQIKEGMKKAIAMVKKDYGNDTLGKEIIDSIKEGDIKNATPEARGYLAKAFKDMLPVGPHVMKLWVRAERPFDYDNPAHVRQVAKWYKDNIGSEYVPIGRGNMVKASNLPAILKDGQWEAIETEDIQEAIKSLGFDSFYVKEHGHKNLAVYDPNQVKSATGNVGTFSRESPDVRYSLKQVKDIFNRAEEIPMPAGVESIRDQWIGGVSGVGDRDAMYDLYRVNGSKKYIQDVQDFVRKELGDQFKGYRLMSNDELEELKTGAMGTQFASFTLNPDVARAFKNIPAYSKKSGMSVVEMDLTPEHVNMIGHPGELELVIDYGQGYNPSEIKVIEKYSLKNVAFPSVKEAQEAADNTPVPDTKEFKQYIAGSQWVDEDGKAKKFFHATTSDFVEFQDGVIYLSETAKDSEKFGRADEDRLRARIYRALNKVEKLPLFQRAVDKAVEDGKITAERGQKFMADAKRSIPEFDRYPSIKEEMDAELIALAPKRMKIMPLYARSMTPFDFRNPEHVDQVATKVNRGDLRMSEEVMKMARELKAPSEYPDHWYRGLPGLLKQGYPKTIEDERVQKAIRELGFDGYITRQNKSAPLSYAVYKANQVKSITGNLGDYSPESKDIRYSLREFNKQDLPQKSRDYTLPENTLIFHGAYKERADRIEETGGVLLSRPPMRVSGGATNEGGLIFFGGEETARRYANSEADPMAVKAAREFGVERLPGKVFKTVTDRPYTLINRYHKINENEAEVLTKALGLPDYKALSAGDPLEVAATRATDYDNSNIDRYEVTRRTGQGKEKISAPWPVIFRALGVDGFFDGFSVALTADNGIRLIGDDGRLVKYSLPSISTADKTRMREVVQQRYEPGWTERVIGGLKQDYTGLRQKLLNRYERLAQYDRLLREKIRQAGGPELLADQSAESAALFSDLGAGITASAMGIGDRQGGIPVYRNGITTVDPSVKGLVASLAPLAKYGDPEIYERYQFWAGWKRGRRLLAEGRERNYTAADAAIAQRFEAAHPEFVQVQKDLNAFNDGIVKYLVDTGVISKERGQVYMQYADYIPFYRQFDLDKTIGPNPFSGISGVRGPKALKGGDAPIGDFMENLVRNTQSAINAGLKNTAAQRATNVAMRLNGPGQVYIERLPGPTAGVGYDVYTVLEKGQLVYYRSGDHLFIDALKSLNMPDLPFMGLLSAPANALRNLVTKDPGFMMANLLRDSLSSYVTSGQNVTPIVGTMVNFGKALTGKNPGMQALFNAGIIGGYEFSQNIEQSGKSLEKDLEKKAGKGNILFKPFKSVWEGLEKGTTASDAATRMAVYERVMKETGNEAEALFRALEVMNFNRKGNSPIIRIATAAIPFFNARLQGLDLFYRASTGKMDMADAKMIQKKFWVRGMTMAALSVMYYFSVAGEDEYEDQEQETKDNNWLFPGLGIRIPIPFEVGVLFKTMPERITAYAFGNNTGEDLAASIKRALVGTFGFNPIPQTFKPLVEVATNYNFFTMRPIVGQGLAEVSPEFQVGPGTSRVAEKLGAATGLSPMKIDQLIKGYTGTIGGYVTDLVDVVLDLNNDSPKAAKRFEQLPIVKRFALDPEARGSVTQFYEMQKAVDTTVRTMNLLERSARPEDFAKFVQDNLGPIAVKDYVRDLEKSMKELRGMKQAIQTATMTGEDKQEALTAIGQAEKNLTRNIQTVKKAISELK